MGQNVHFRKTKQKVVVTRENYYETWHKTWWGKVLLVLFVTFMAVITTAADTIAAIFW